MASLLLCLFIVVESRLSLPLHDEMEVEFRWISGIQEYNI